jgi:hypothetical protein
VPAALARVSAAQVGALGEETGVINTGARQQGGKLNLSARASVVMVEVSGSRDECATSFPLLENGI